MKNCYYAPPESISGDTVIFPEEEAHHAARVHRAKTGDEARVVDGEGRWYRVRLEILGRKSVVGSILEVRGDVGEPSYELTIGVGLLKNTSRFEIFLEKAVELGVRRIVPLVTRRSEKSRLKTVRARSILISAMKQTGRSRLVELDEPIKIRKWFKNGLDGEAGLNAMCHEEADVATSLAGLIRTIEPRRKATVLVGPEGGFSPEEVEKARTLGFEIVSLGSRRLRTETAAISVAATFMALEYERSPGGSERGPA